MKKIIALMLALVMVISLGACGSEPATESKSSEPVAESKASDPAPSQSQAPETSSESATAPVNGVEVEKNLFSVEITLPASLVEEGETQETLDDYAKEQGYKSATLNPDGSVTYKMTKDQHKQLIEEITTEIDAALLDFQEDPNLPSIVVAEANDDYTNFTLILSTDKVGFIEAFASIPLFIYGETYHVFNGTNPESIIVSYIDQASGNVIETATSPGLEGLSEWLSDAE